MTDKKFLELNKLSVQYKMGGNSIFALQDVSLSIEKGSALGIVGESGSGKSTLALAIMGLLDKRAKISGEMKIGGEEINLSKAPDKVWRKLRGTKVAMVFQDSLSSLNPLMKVGDQIAETMFVKKTMSKKDAKTKSIELLELVEIPEAKQRYSQYPHELSGGTRQRIMIAMAIANNPDLLICDEPTTALDVTVQAQILGMLKRLQKDTSMTMLLVTHDLGVVSSFVDELRVMYSGKIVESGTTKSVMQNPSHPYTFALLNAMPSLGSQESSLKSIPGEPPALDTTFSYCPFSSRCRYVGEECKDSLPTLEHLENDLQNHQVACFYPLKMDKKVF